MSCLDHLSLSFIPDLLLKVYNKLSVTTRFPWKNYEDFSKDWFSAIHDTIEGRNKLLSCLGGNSALRESCLEAMEEFVRGYPSAVQGEVRHLQETIRSLAADKMEDNPAIDIGDQLDTVATRSELKPCADLPDACVNELLKSLPEGCDLDPSTTEILGYHPDASDGDVSKFSVDMKPRPQSNYMFAESHEKKHALTALSRISRKGVHGHPKKEYFRCQHIRAIKKALRQLQKNKKSKASIHKVESNTQETVWEEMKRLFANHRKAFISISDTATGPTTDGKKKKKDAQKSQSQRSFNNEFCSKFFEDEAVRRFNSLFCTLVYSATPGQMCKKMKASCCQEDVHTETCEEKWELIHAYAREGMLRELNLEPLSSSFEPALDPDVCWRRKSSPPTYVPTRRSLTLQDKAQKLLH